MLRGISSVVLGYLLWSVLWISAWQAVIAAMPGSFREDGSTTSVGILVLFLVVAPVLSVASGWTAAKVSGAPHSRWPRALGVLLLASGIFFQLGAWELMPLWFHLPFLALLYPATMFGARSVGGRPQVAAA